MKQLNQLLDLLRAAGFVIPPAVVIEITTILPVVATTEELRLALRMLIVQSKQQQDLFDFIWSIVFRELQEEDPEESDSSNDSTHSSATGSDQPISGLPLAFSGITDAEYCPNPDAVAAGTVGSNDPSVALIRFASDLKGPARQMIQGNYENAAAILLRYLLTATTDITQFGIQRQQAMAQIEEMLDYAVVDHSTELMQRLEAKLDELLTQRIEMKEIIGRHQLKVQDLEELPIISLQTSAELHQTLHQLGRKLASKHIRKKKKGRQKINLRQTIRANIQHGGTLLELKQHNPHVDKPKLVILTDVSSSTIKATRMFLTILWHAKHVFSDIRFFEFIASVIDVTTEWKRAESVDQAVDQALKRWNEQPFGKQNSDYHQALLMFSKQYSSSLSSRDTIIILGDLRDWLGPWVNGSPVSASVLDELQHLVKRVLVLNPEQKNVWNTGDSIVGYVQATGIEVFEVDTLDKLVDVMLDLS